jgi:hypothetical protein
MGTRVPDTTGRRAACLLRFARRRFRLLQMLAQERDRLLARLRLQVMPDPRVRFRFGLGWRNRHEMAESFEVQASRGLPSARRALEPA